MQDNQLIKLFRPLIAQGLADLGYNNVSVVQAYQPTQQGVNTGPTVFFYKMMDTRDGSHKYAEVYDPINNVYRHAEEQRYRTTFQVSALVAQKPANPLDFTASDLVNDVAYIMQSEQTIAGLNAGDVGILRVTDIANPYFSDDRDQYEASPSFNFILCHKQIRVSNVPVIESYVYNIKRV